MTSPNRVRLLGQPDEINVNSLLAEGAALVESGCDQVPDGAWTALLLANTLGTLSGTTAGRSYFTMAQMRTLATLLGVQLSSTAAAPALRKQFDDELIRLIRDAVPDEEQLRGLGALDQPPAWAGEYAQDRQRGAADLWNDSITAAGHSSWGNALNQVAGLRLWLYRDFCRAASADLTPAEKNVMRDSAIRAGLWLPDRGIVNLKTKEANLTFVRRRALASLLGAPVEGKVAAWEPMAASVATALSPGTPDVNLNDLLDINASLVAGLPTDQAMQCEGDWMMGARQVVLLSGKAALLLLANGNFLPSDLALLLERARGGARDLDEPLALQLQGLTSELPGAQGWTGSHPPTSDAATAAAGLAGPGSGRGRHATSRGAVPARRRPPRPILA